MCNLHFVGIALAAYDPNDRADQLLRRLREPHSDLAGGQGAPVQWPPRGDRDISQRRRYAGDRDPSLVGCALDQARDGRLVAA